MHEKTYIAIDLKSFYASVECVERGLDPLTTNLVVADASRTQKTICLAVSPSLKAYSIPGRPRLFEVIQKVDEINIMRRHKIGNENFETESYDDSFVRMHPWCKLSYIVAPPRMAYYIYYSTKVYNVYLKYIAPEDIHVYSIDEVFMDVTNYLSGYKMTAKELAMKIILDVLDTSGITATAGIGPNLYLCKVAMDIVAKHIPPDENGVRIAQLDEISYRKQLWEHWPITDFWRVGKGYARKLEAHGLYTMGDIAKCSIGKPNEYYNEDLLYRLFGINAELLIDHAWGWENCEIKDIKAYRPGNSSLCSSQVLDRGYTCEQTRIIVKEMADMMALDLVDKALVSNQFVLTLSYDAQNLKDPGIKSTYRGQVTKDAYGRAVPKHAHSTVNMKEFTSSGREIIDAVLELYERIVNPSLLIRKVSLTANHVIYEKAVSSEKGSRQLSLLYDYEEEQKRENERNLEKQKEKRMQKVMLSIKKKYGKNALLKGMNLQDGAKARERNEQIGGHRA